RSWMLWKGSVKYPDPPPPGVAPGASSRVGSVSRAIVRYEYPSHLRNRFTYDGELRLSRGSVRRPVRGDDGEFSGSVSPHSTDAPIKTRFTSRRGLFKASTRSPRVPLLGCADDPFSSAAIRSSQSASPIFTGPWKRVCL